MNSLKYPNLRSNKSANAKMAKLKRNTRRYLCNLIFDCNLVICKDTICKPALDYRLLLNTNERNLRTVKKTNHML